MLCEQERGRSEKGIETSHEDFVVKTSNEEVEQANAPRKGLKL
jgi:hypothetical protein